MFPRIRNMSALLAIFIAAAAGSASGLQAVSAAGLLLPPGAKAGECYARVRGEPVSRTQTERVIVRRASEEIRVIPARYETVSERVLVREASTRLEVVSAVFETTSEQVLVRPAYTTWKKGTGPIQWIDEATGEIMCFVKVPAEYAPVRQQVLRAAATTRETTIHAEHRTVESTRLVSPGHRAADSDSG